MSQVLLIAALTCLGLLPWGNRVIRLLLEHNIGKNIRFDGPASHQVKAGTATMGGLYFVGGIALVSVIAGLAGYAEVWIPLLATLAFAALGAYDDWQGLADRRGVGWLARSKFAWQWLVALAVASGAYWAGSGQVAFWADHTFRLGLGVIPVLAISLVAMANAVNLTDGVDGLAGSTAAIAFGACGILALARGQQGLAIFCGIVGGGLLAFLWYNVHPARVFMGDTGSQALGAGLAAVAVISGQWLVLPFVAIVFVCEALSVVLQVSYFKYSRKRFGEGRRILRMSPLHHHFELSGWSETQIVYRFTLVAIMGAALAIILSTG